MHSIQELWLSVQTNPHIFYCMYTYWCNHIYSCIWYGNIINQYSYRFIIIKIWQFVTYFKFAVKYCRDKPNSERSLTQVTYSVALGVAPYTILTPNSPCNCQWHHSTTNHNQLGNIYLVTPVSRFVLLWPNKM